ncbi:uncharacterized protein E6C27_scaffold498G00490 [Cucumis melo var. makuwa]|uniref:Plant transposase n=1 Tax=Cucumis melo var. makuwa TaxID=1194695 RepID=A0A5A7TZR2_CUCMM|nr:uncharacterized protein E6C27_scaffold498G00490 [Cucumis melo var. makuwa]
MVKQIQSTSNNEELSKMKPSNIQSTQDLMDFVNEKKSKRFKAESAKFKSMKKRKLPHTCSRKGYARLAEDMKKNSMDSSSVTRVALWTKAHRKKDGTPVNSEVAETLERINEIENEGINTSSKDVANDAISKGNGSDQLSNAANDQVVNNVATNPIGTSPPSINNNNTLLTVHHVPLDPHAVRVWMDLPNKLDAFLWRPNSEMTYIEDAVGSTVVWPLDKVILS